MGSFSQAASALNIPRATATYAIKELESSLGTRLLDRTTRHVRTTHDGQAFYERCVRLLGELDNAFTSVRQSTRDPQGVLRVDMHGTHATTIVLPNIHEFHAKYPHIELVVSSGDRLVDLVREGIDCVIRAGTPRDSTLIARKLAVLPQVVCASPAYLDTFGTPRHPQDLSKHKEVRFFSRSGTVRYPLQLTIKDKTENFFLESWISVNDAENYVTSALHGYGLIQVPRFHVENALRQGKLVEILPEWSSPDLPLSVLHPQREHIPQRLRVFIDWLRKLYKRKFDPA